MEPRVLAVFGRGIVPLNVPLLRADDHGVMFGDGAFETMHVRAGTAWLLDEHLTRLAESARRLGLDLPPATALPDLVATALGAWPADREGAVKLVVTRGPSDGVPSIYALVSPVNDTALRQRREGIRVVTAPLGLAADARANAPWLLGGVKSLSFGVNMAALRWAAGQGLDDLIFLASDGQVLDGATSSVVWATAGTLCTIPDDTGILPGITAASLLDHASELGLATDRRRATVPDLIAADSVWLTSSVRGVVRVTELNGEALADAGLTPQLSSLLGYPG